MTDATGPTAELLEKAGEGDLLRTVAEAVPRLLTESGVEGLIGAPPRARGEAPGLSQRVP